ANIRTRTFMFPFFLPPEPLPIAISNCNHPNRQLASEIGNLSLPFTLQYKPSPVIRRLPLLLLEHLDLSGTQCGGRSLVSLQHSCIDALHQQCSGFIIDVPKTDNDPTR